jgi:hypothetical protein
MYAATKKLYLNKTRSRVVEEGHPEAGQLLAEAGQAVTTATAEAYGLHLGEEPMCKAITAAPENKAVMFPAATKRSKRR